MSVFSERLKELRKAQGVTQKSVADYLGIAERNYRNYEIIDALPSIVSLSKLADYFGVTTDYLIGRKNYWVDDDGNIQTMGSQRAN